MTVTFDYLKADLDIKKAVSLLRLRPLYHFYWHDY